MATADTKPTYSWNLVLCGLCAFGIMVVGTVATLIIRDVITSPDQPAPAPVLTVAVTAQSTKTTPLNPAPVVAPAEDSEPADQITVPKNEVTAAEPMPEEPAIVPQPPPAVPVAIAPVVEPEEELELPDAEPAAPKFLVPQTDYFTLLHETKKAVIDHIFFNDGAPYRFIEIDGPEGQFTICFSEHGYWNGSKGNKMQWSDGLRGYGYVYVTLLTPGGHPITIGWCEREGDPPIYEILFTQNQTIFGTKFRGYVTYDPELDELKTVDWAVEQHGGMGRQKFRHIPRVKVGKCYLYFYRQVSFSRKRFDDVPPGSISGMWGTFEGLQSFDPETLRVTRYWYDGPETGFLKDATLDGDELTLTFIRNATRDLKVTFSPDAGFSEATPVEAKN